MGLSSIHAPKDSNVILMRKCKAFQLICLSACLWFLSVHVFLSICMCACLSSFWSLCSFPVKSSSSTVSIEQKNIFIAWLFNCHHYYGLQNIPHTNYVHLCCAGVFWWGCTEIRLIGRWFRNSSTIRLPIPSQYSSITVADRRGTVHLFCSFQWARNGMKQRMLFDY